MVFLLFKTSNEILEREEYYILNLNPEYNIASVDGSEPTNFEERNTKISQSILESWKSGKLKERKEQKQRLLLRL